MIGDRVKAQREARGWTQEHLSEAAGIAVRTVQRIESHHSHSAETLLAIAAAFDMDPRELTRPDATTRGEHRPLWPAMDPRRAARIAAVLVAPAILFVSLSLLKYGAGIAAPYDLLADFGARHGLHAAFDRFSAPVLLFSPLVALILTIVATIRPAGLVERDSVTVTGVELTWHWPTVLAACAASAVLGLLSLYIIGEKLGQVARMATG
jgi:transcriptional regulator with XRE-family HTH domain